MNEKEAFEICEKSGWEINKAKYFLSCKDSSDFVSFNTLKELINYSKELKRARE